MHIKPQSLGVIHFIGIGGIGMSGIAEILHTQGYTVRGSDQSENANVKRLRLLGLPIFIGHDASQVEGAAVVVISSAVKADNPELVETQRRHIPYVKRAEMLAEIMRLSPSIAVAGTHGKTTTTSMGAVVLGSAGLDPTVVSGGIINAYGTNARLGAGTWTIVEADESDGTFTQLPATIAIVTNIDCEHMDHYGAEENLDRAFLKFVENIPFYGLGILCADHPKTLALSQEILNRRIVTYGFAPESDIRAFDLEYQTDGIRFKIALSDHFFRVCPTLHVETTCEDYFLPMIGDHNVQNALSIIACGLELELSHAQIKKGLIAFDGVKRRFTHVGTWNDVKLVDDYAHHPKEIQAVLTAARKSAEGRVIAIAQPHRYSRLENLFEEFCGAFSHADQVYIAPVYAAGESPSVVCTHHKLAQGISEHDPNLLVKCITGSEEIPDLIRSIAQPKDLIVFMGAGDITQWAYQTYEILSQDQQEQEEETSNSSMQVVV